MDACAQGQRWKWGRLLCAGSLAACIDVEGVDGGLADGGGLPVVVDAAASGDGGRFDAEAPRADAGGALDAACERCDDASVAPPGDAAVAAPDAAIGDAAVSAVPACEVKPIPASLRTGYELPAFYTRYADADGVPIIASAAPADEALHRACLLVFDYARARADVKAALLRQKIRFAVMGAREKTVDLPEFAHLGDIDWRARGLGSVPIAVCAEENVLCDRSTDRWRGESICVHEFAHTMHLGGYAVADKTFNTRLDAAYRAAKAAGLYKNTYAESQAAEYLAEGVQDWYDTNLEANPPNGVHNEINTRAELKRYDPTLYALLAEVLPDKPAYRDCYHYE
jgi:hypothetical protein